MGKQTDLWVIRGYRQVEVIEKREEVMAEAFVYDAVRTPRGKGKPDGSLHSIKPVSLVTGLLHAVFERNPKLPKDAVDDIVLGCVTPIGDQGSDIAKTSAIAAGLPDTVAGVQVNRFCASGLEAVNLAAQKVRSGFEDFVLAGGVESMSRVPIGSDGGAWAMDPLTNFDTCFVPQGVGADLIATIDGYSRADVDAFACESQRRASNARDKGYFAKSLVPVRDRNGLPVLTQDEFIKPSTTMEGLAKLKPSFELMGEMGGFDAVALQKYHYVEAIRHVHTPGNSSGIVDGAALVVIGSDTRGKQLGLAPRGRIVATALSGADPTIMLTGPAPAARKALAKAGLDAKQIDLWEINEAFASVALRFMKAMELPHEIVNVNGGAIAMGHPLGATGAMIVGTILDELERRSLRYGLCTLCVGGGMGIATIIERL
jgi:acetyl-CoA C-acetyltransferase